MSESVTAVCLRLCAVNLGLSYPAFLNRCFTIPLILRVESACPKLLLLVDVKSACSGNIFVRVFRYSLIAVSVSVGIFT